MRALKRVLSRHLFRGESIRPISEHSKTVSASLSLSIGEGLAETSRPAPRRVHLSVGKPYRAAPKAGTGDRSRRLGNHKWRVLAGYSNVLSPWDD